MFHYDANKFVRESAVYGPIGHAITALSDLEWRHDKLILDVNRTSPKLAKSISKKFPRHFRDKTDFLIELLWRHSRLRGLPIFVDGSLDTLWLQYQLDELYDLRAKLAHGSVLLIEGLKEGSMWRLERTTVPSTGMVSSELTEIGDGILADVVWTSKSLSLYLSKLSMVFLDELDPEREYQKEKEIIRNQQLRRELIAVGAVEPDEWDRALLGLEL